MKIFVGNLAFKASPADLQRLFEGFGVVTSAVIVMEKKEAKSRGFGFVEMPDDQEADAAIASLNNKDFMGRMLNVSPALSKLELRPEKNRKESSPSTIKLEASFVRPRPGKSRIYTRGSFFEENRGYKEGRRSRSFLKRRKFSAEGEQAKTPRKKQGNPMRWRKKQGRSRPWNATGAVSNPRETGETGKFSGKSKVAAPGPMSLGPGRPQRPSFRRHKISGGPKRRKTR